MYRDKTMIYRISHPSSTHPSYAPIYSSRAAWTARGNVFFFCTYSEYSIIPATIGGAAVGQNGGRDGDVESVYVSVAQREDAFIGS